MYANTYQYNLRNNLTIPNNTCMSHSGAGLFCDLSMALLTYALLLYSSSCILSGGSLSCFTCPNLNSTYLLHLQMPVCATRYLLAYRAI